MMENHTMAKRDWFAAFALAGMMARPDIHSSAAFNTVSGSAGTLHLSDEQLAERAYRLADSMLKAGDSSQS